MKIIKPKIKVAGTGHVDECDCCNKEFVTGIAGFTVDGWKPIELCWDCLKNKFEEVE